jgi:hypothetical protein
MLFAVNVVMLFVPGLAAFVHPADDHPLPVYHPTYPGTGGTDMFYSNANI